MINTRKIINDAVHGFITIPNDFLYELLQHRFVHRLTRIQQLGVSSLVYPSATHTRFQHSLGAMHLTSKAVKELQQKGHNITQEESDAVMAAILLHDIGHCPYSHLLEHTLIKGISHETITELMMKKISSEMDGQLDMAIDIFKNRYHKKFLHQLVSSQLDMDRLDYLMRDSFFTGVVEGSIGSARIINMLDIADDSLVVEQKGILSVENYLITRRFMYWQIYYHKTSLAAETMLKKILQRVKTLLAKGETIFASPSLLYFLYENVDNTNFASNPQNIETFVDIDDSDILSAIKVWAYHNDKILSILCKGFINRHLFKAHIMPTNISQDALAKLTKEEGFAIAKRLGLDEADGEYLSSYQVIGGNKTYNFDDNKIMVRTADNKVRDIAECSSIVTPESLSHDTTKKYIFYYKK